MKTIQLFPTLLLFSVSLGCNKAPQTYSASCSAPLSGWGTEKSGLGHHLPIMPVYVGSDGSVLWNRVTISDAQLRKYMGQANALNPVPQVILEASPSATCDRIKTIRAIMDATPMCNGPYSRCSEGWNWRQWPEMGGL